MERINPNADNAFINLPIDVHEEVVDYLDMKSRFSFFSTCMALRDTDVRKRIMRILFSRIATDPRLGTTAKLINYFKKNSFEKYGPFPITRVHLPGGSIRVGAKWVFQKLDADSLKMLLGLCPDLTKLRIEGSFSLTGTATAKEICEAIPEKNPAIVDLCLDGLGALPKEEILNLVEKCSKLETLEVSCEDAVCFQEVKDGEITAAVEKNSLLRYFDMKGDNRLHYTYPRADEAN